VKFTIFGGNNERKTSIQALRRAKFEFDFRQIKTPAKIEDILSELQNLFDLSSPPKKIEAFDAAHISGTDLTAAKIAWENGKFLTGENEFWLFDEASEPDSLRLAIGERFRKRKTLFPDLLLIDGGKAQLQAALQAGSFLKKREFMIICAVKPPGRHAEISHFLAENGARIEFSNESEAMRILLRLRDEAHNFANTIHRLHRESAHFYKDVKPLIVPIRFDDPNGDAQDLQPLGYIKIMNRKRKTKV
jgi:excinuclease ABC subunit C